MYFIIILRINTRKPGCSENMKHDNYKMFIIKNVKWLFKWYIL